jgi:hypothetical protein
MKIELIDVLENIQQQTKISISYLQISMPLGFISARRLYNELIGFGCISTDGNVLHEKVYLLLEECKSNLEQL